MHVPPFVCRCIIVLTQLYINTHALSRESFQILFVFFRPRSSGFSSITHTKNAALTKQAIAANMGDIFLSQCVFAAIQQYVSPE